jgi:xanthine/CO dehydrogenase XdhC/CoxF family maturation factor
MRELRDILDAYERLSDCGEAGVLASVVHVEGSTYRRTGARMLVLPDETLVGLISGGCLEGDLLEHARRVRATGAPELVKYDHRGEDDIVWGLGLGCAGAVDVWLERVDRAHPGPLAWLATWSDARENGALATALSGRRAGERRALGAQSGLAGTLAHAAVDAALRECLASGGGRHFAVPALGGDVLIEVVRTPLRLALFGAGPDAIPLARFARELGWDVAVMDHRAAYAVADRFPGADVRLAEVPLLVERAEVDARTHAVVMTHHYLHDRTILRGLLASAAPYVAVLGPKQRTRDLLADLEKEGAAVGEDERARVFGPAGLDIGADAPEEIALAICAEVQAFASRRPGGALRKRKGPIHEPAS